MPRHIEFRHVAMLSLALEPRPCAIHRRRARRQDRACRQHLPNVRPNRFSRLCTRRIPGRRYPVRSRLRHGQSGAQRTAVPTYGARCGIDLEAVHGDVDADPREGGQAVPRRSCSEALPRDAAYADGITWRRALSQTSGLRDLWVTWAQTGRSFAGDTVDALNVIFHSAEPNYTPGERYLYTNTGWILAAQAVYRLTGKTLAQFAEERIFRPLGMRDTRFLSDRYAIIPNLSESYGLRDLDSASFVPTTTALSRGRAGSIRRSRTPAAGSTTMKSPP